MAVIEVNPEKRESFAIATGTQHKFQLSPPKIFDYGFERIDDEVLLSFSLLDPQITELKVRLYECNNRGSILSRRRTLTEYATKNFKEPGLTKSGYFHEMQSGELLSDIAKKHGFHDEREVFDHFLNEELQNWRGTSGSLGEGDSIYIPQLRREEPIPLGVTLSTESVDEEVEGGQRYMARWKILENVYDPLEFARWVPEQPAPRQGRRGSQRPAAGQTVFYLPMFVVMNSQSRVLGVSPTPTALAAETEYDVGPDWNNAVVIFANGDSRGLSAPSGVEAITKEEEPLVFFSASTGAADEEQRA